MAHAASGYLHTQPSAIASSSIPMNQGGEKILIFGDNSITSSSIPMIPPQNLRISLRSKPPKVSAAKLDVWAPDLFIFAQPLDLQPPRSARRAPAGTLTLVGYLLHLLSNSLY